MGDEAVDGSKMGTKLIMFVAIIGLALVAFLVGKALVNTGVDNLESSARNINDSRFSDYNNKVVKGRSVKSALDTFANEEVIILVHTLTEGDVSSNDTGTVSSFVDKVNEGRSSDDQIKRKTSINENQIDPSDGTEQAIEVQTTGTGKSLKLDNNTKIGGSSPIFMNYNALAESSTKHAVSIDKDGGYVYDADFVTDKSTAAVLYNLQTRYTTKKGAAEYIADGSSFDASLIKNTSGEIVGIVFSQKKIS